VEQGYFRIGYTAATLLGKMMKGKRVDAHAHRCVGPTGVISRQSTDVLHVEDRDIAKALRLIHNEACRGLTSASVCEAVSLSRSTMDKRFKATIGRTVDQEIRRVRLARAKALLTRSTMPLREVACEAGYGNEQYLVRVIRNATNMTPAQYRSEHRARLRSALRI
jgi:LacI family transcriptional regulator